jgi:DNA replication and repair protein RecF
VRVDRLVLEDFRNYENESVEFAAGLNLVTGRNAQGKTNLLEAIYCLSGLGSPRGPDAGLVKDGSERALLHADVTHGVRALHVDIEFRPGKGTRALINKTPTSGTRSLRELVVAVFFGPDELSLIKGSPDGRRRFLDDLVVKLRPIRDSLRREWERTLKQRNALLKSAPHAGRGGDKVRETLEVWDESFCRAGAALTAARLEALRLLLPFVRKRYEEIAGSGRVELAYSSNWIEPSLCDRAVAVAGDVTENEIRADLRAALERVRGRELERGVSLVGPQRDDATIRLAAGGDGAMLDARVYASQGDQRTAALALKFAEHDLLSDALGDQPVLLLDDVFSELDPSRRAWLAESARAMGQTLLSSAEPDSLDALGPARWIRVTGGKLHAEAGR